MKNMRMGGLIKLGILALGLLAFAGGGTGGHLRGAVTIAGSPSVFPRVISPNGDGINDTVFFFFENGTAAPSQGAVYDLKSQKVADLQESGVAVVGYTVLAWGGTDESGSVVPAGIYLYRAEVGGQTFTGTVGVVR